MNKSESITELAKALNKFEGEFTGVRKDSKVKTAQYSFEFASLGTIWDTIRPLLKECGLSVVQGACPDLVEGHLVMETTLIHTSGEWVQFSLPLKPQRDDPQGMGSAITYARRYGLSAMLGIVADEDDDAEGDKKNTAPVQKPTPKPTQSTQSVPTETVSTNPQSDLNLPEKDEKIKAYEEQRARDKAEGRDLSTITDKNLLTVLFQDFKLQPKDIYEMLGIKSMKELTDSPAEIYGMVSLVVDKVKE